MSNDTTPSESRSAWSKQRRSLAESVLLIEADERVAALVGRRLRRLGYEVVVRPGLHVDETDPTSTSLALANEDIVGPALAQTFSKVHLGRDAPTYVAYSDSTSPDALQSALGLLARRFSQNFADLARHRKVLAGPELLHVDDLVVDLARQTLICSGTPHVLQPQEASLLALLVQHPEKPLSYQFIADQAWPADACVSRLTMAVHVRWLREKIESDPSDPKRIRTVRGHGYVYHHPPQIPA